LRHPLLLAALSFAAGIAISSPGTDPPAVLGAALSLPLAALLLLLSAAAGRRRRLARAGYRLAALAAAWVLAGAGAVSLRDPAAAGIEALPPVEHALEAGEPVPVEGIVISLPRLREGRLRLRLRPERLDGTPLPGVAGPCVMTLSVGGDPRGTVAWSEHLLPGDRLRASARLRLPRPFRNPGGFDLVRYLRRQGIAVGGSVKSSLLLERLASGPPTPRRALARIRRRLLAPLDRRARRMPGGGPDALLAAMTWGDRSAVDPRDRQALIASGTYHLLAISGMHVGLVIVSLLAAARAVGLGPATGRAVVLALLPAYAALAGGSAPVVRAVLMAATLIAARAAGRAATPLNALGAALLAVLVVSPVALFDPGLQLSAVATASVLRFGPALSRLARGPRLLRATAAASVASLLGAGPWLARTSHWIAPVGVLANLLAVPLSGLAVLGGAVGCILDAAHPGAGRPALWAAELAARGLVASSRWLATVPGGSWPSAGPAAGVLAAYYLLLAAVACMPPAWRQLRRLVLGLLVVAALAVGAGAPGTGADGCLRLYVLDVGQGDSILLRLPDGAAVLIDGGGLAGSSFDLGGSVVAPALWALGVRRVDLLVGTHPHHDHLGGLASVIERFPTREVWLGAGPAADPDVAALVRACVQRGARLRHARAGVTRDFGAASLRVLHPTGAFPRDDANEASLVIEVRYKGRRLLLAGDAGASAERTLALRHLPGRIDILKVGHHGSRTATTAEFLERMRPAWAVISVGERNAWGHPDPEVLGRLADAGVRVRRTDRHGMVTFTTDGRWVAWGVEDWPRGPRAGSRPGTAAGPLPPSSPRGARRPPEEGARQGARGDGAGSGGGREGLPGAPGADPSGRGGEGG
jgi:competence protein ComEC